MAFQVLGSLLILLAFLLVTGRWGVSGWVSADRGVDVLVVGMTRGWDCCHEVTKRMLWCG